MVIEIKRSPEVNQMKLVFWIYSISSFSTFQKMMNERKQKMKWIVILWYIYIHVLGVYGIWLMFTSAKWITIFYTIFITAIGCFGMTAGAHRLWAHRTYECESLVKLFLMIAHTSAGVGSIYNWVLYHRIHHKYYGTDKDPYNHKKGFLYSYYISNVLSPNMNLEEMKRNIDLSDIENDIYVYFQKIFYWLLFLIFGLILPLNVPLEYWNESLIETVLITGFLRFAIIINISWLMNSALLVWNIKEGEKIPLKTISIFFLKKSFWPKYHYKIPWDWKCGEFGIYDDDWTTFFIKMAHELNLVNSLLTVDTEDIRDMLHEISIKEITLEDGLEKLKKKSIFNMEKTKLIKKY